jgi:hypothetical protein
VDVLEGEVAFDVMLLKDWGSGRGVPSLLCCVDGAALPGDFEVLGAGGR